jgi:NAD(P)-dependent dehydrogenase (short-subunit alcohol dehydrogenase family)
MFSVEGRVAVVTGASSGLGERFARVLHEWGAHVVAVARRADRLRALAGELDGVLAHPADLADRTQAASVIDAVVDRFGRVDVLVNNAGVAKAMPAIDEPIEDFAYTVEVNLISLFELSRSAARSMISAGRGGSIINIASALGLVAAAPLDNAGYAASKGGVVNLTRELACQWASDGIRVNAIAPGFFPSEITADMVDDEQFMRHIRRNTPLGRPGRADELDGVLLFLASDASTYVTGQTIAVDGGWTAR